MERVGIYQITATDLRVMAEEIMLAKCKHVEIPSKVAASILGISVPTLSRWRAAGFIHAVNEVKEGGCMIFRLSDVLSLDKVKIQKEYRLLHK
ncbi:helix-turn-helix domain-containing protein [Butyricimonas synergistica]|uniref:helix-turn-helix domain-containing protein n=1 Tax=Butyricimonas synergistica TaxID=544644 RepID=UPI0022E25D04|nr:helix-turn-helix domain-containing protein [Butyricimonas synergistica]